MGLLMYIIGMGFFAAAIYGAATSQEKRRKFLKDFLDEPFVSVVAVLWMTFITMFVVGVFVPGIGERELLDSGWQIWEVGAVGTFGIFGLQGLYSLIKTSR